MPMANHKQARHEQTRHEKVRQRQSALSPYSQVPEYCLVLEDMDQAKDAYVQQVLRELGLRCQEGCVARVMQQEKARLLSQALARRGISVTILPPTPLKPASSQRMLMRINIALCSSVLILLGLYFFTAHPLLTARPTIKASQAFGGNVTKNVVPEGEIAPHLPRQSMLELPQQWHHQLGNTTYHVEAVAQYTLEARILSKKRYRFDRMARLAPWDMVVGWQAMSDNRWLEHINIQQQGRWYHWRALDNEIDNVPIDSDIALSSANMHLIPADDYLRRRLEGLQKHQLVRLQGYLVNIHDDKGYYWQSSLRRDDEGLGACEIFWLTDVRILPKRYFLQ